MTPLLFFSFIFISWRLISSQYFSGFCHILTWISHGVRHLFLISSTFVKSLPFLSFIGPILAWNVSLISPIFLKISLIFLVLLLYSISLHCSFKEAFLSLLSVLWNSAFSWVYIFLSPLPFSSLLSSAICKTSLDKHSVFWHFFFFGMALVTVFCTMLQISSHSSLGTLTDIIPWIYLSPSLYNHKGFDLGHTWMA